jgi:hypothetical protein
MCKVSVYYRKTEKTAKCKQLIALCNGRHRAVVCSLLYYRYFVYILSLNGNWNGGGWGENNHIQVVLLISFHKTSCMTYTNFHSVCSWKMCTIYGLCSLAGEYQCSGGIYCLCLLMKAVCSFKTKVPTYHTTWSHNPLDLNMNLHYHEILKSHTYKLSQNIC